MLGSALRSALGPVTSALTESRPASVSGTAWDPANKAAIITLSNANRTATADNSGVLARVATTIARSTGKRAIKATGVFTDAGYQIQIGVVPTNWDTSTEDPLEADRGFGFDGYQSPGVTDLSIPVTSGHAGFLYVDFDAGEAWCDNESNAYAVDREAGTNPHFTFTANTSLLIGACVIGETGVATASLTLDPTYSSGTFAAWDA